MHVNQIPLVMAINYGSHAMESNSVRYRIYKSVFKSTIKQQLSLAVTIPFRVMNEQQQQLQEKKYTRTTFICLCLWICTFLATRHTNGLTASCITNNIRINVTHK